MVQTKEETHDEPIIGYVDRPLTKDRKVEVETYDLKTGKTIEPETATKLHGK